MANIYYLQVTRSCNQSCRFCSNPPNERVIAAARARAMLRSYARRRASGVIFTGGEPTLHPDLPGLVAYAAKLGLEARLVTNGQRTASRAYLASLKRAGLSQMHVSLHSHLPKLQDYLSRKRGSARRVRRTLEHAGALGVPVSVNMVINRYNSGHLHLAVRRLCGDFPFLRHFVFNNMDPGMERVVEFPDTIPSLRGFESSLALAMRWLDGTGRTFRVERVPLCFMAEFPHCSTETRKIVKGEDRLTYFLDEKGLISQKVWDYGKPERCAACRLSPLCAGLYKLDRYYDTGDLCPVFADPAAVARRVRETGS